MFFDLALIGKKGWREGKMLETFIAEVRPCMRMKRDYGQVARVEDVQNCGFVLMASVSEGKL